MREALRAEHFISQCEKARKQAFVYKDGKFFANFAYQRAFLSQVRYLQGDSPSEFLVSLRQALSDFITGLELGYPTEANEINNWYFRSLLVNDFSLSHFLAALPNDIWHYGDEFPRFQAYWCFAQLRRQPNEAKKCLDFLYGWCFESDDDPEETEEDQQIKQLEQNCYHIMHSISMKDTDSAVKYMQERCRLRPIIPPEGTRYELFQPLDLLGLGLCRIAMLNGLIVKVNEPSLPMELIFNT
jgi:hypothetical protein